MTGKIIWYCGVTVDLNGNVTHYLRDPKTGDLTPVAGDE